MNNNKILPSKISLEILKTSNQGVSKLIGSWTFKILAATFTHPAAIFCK